MTAVFINATCDLHFRSIVQFYSDPMVAFPIAVLAMSAPPNRKAKAAASKPATNTFDPGAALELLVKKVCRVHMFRYLCSIIHAAKSFKENWQRTVRRCVVFPYDFQPLHPPKQEETIRYNES